MQPQDVLDFWFDQPPKNWFRKNVEFDAEVRTRFGAVIDQAVGGGLRAWDDAGATGTLAHILVLDQFTRNAWRGTPASFSGDALALAGAQSLVASGADQSLNAQQRSFVYMPFEHAEDPAIQQQAIALFTQLAAQDASFADSLDYARRHSDVIARFGRFPHRNAILGRTSTPAEVDFLAQPGSGF